MLIHPSNTVNNTRPLSCSSDSKSFSDVRPADMDVCAKLVTGWQGYRESILLGFTRPATIGRNSKLCRLSQAFIVNYTRKVYVHHCHVVKFTFQKFDAFSVRSPTGGVIVSCQDLSRNGVAYNGQTIKRNSVILMDGDVLSLPGPTRIEFTCRHIIRDPQEKLTIFDPTPPPQAAQKRLGKYIVTSQCLGTGSFATVHLALDPTRHRQVACKSIRTRKDNEIEQVMKEVRILMKLKHPNINEIYDTEQDKRFLNIFLQLCTGGDLFTYITGPLGNANPLCEAEAKYLMYQLLQGLCYLHDLMISHRDLKGHLLSPVLQIHPPDIPSILNSPKIFYSRPNAYQETFNVCGTVSYLPPEGVLALDHKHLSYIGMPADCWSSGVILYVMLSGCHPFDNEPDKPRPHESEPSYESSEPSIENRDSRLKERIVYGGVYFPSNPWHNLDDAKKLILELLVHDHSKRATVYGALSSEWIQSEIKDLRSLYRRRITTDTREITP